MNEVSVERLRGLRDRVRELFRDSGADLVPFLNLDGLTFRRKPDSEKRKDDVNVTTTCTSLMASALTRRLPTVYGKDDWKDKARKAFSALVDAPWMSSGLTANNAFTTTLVLRTLGFLMEAKVLLPADAEKDQKGWEPKVCIKDFNKVAGWLREHATPAADCVWRSLTDETRRRIREWDTAKPFPDGPCTALVLEIGRLLQTYVYHEHRFPGVAKGVIEEIEKADTTYKLAVANQHLLTEVYKDGFKKPSAKSFKTIAMEMAADKSLFKINDYPEAAAVVYWFVDAVARAGIQLDPEIWKKLSKWATEKFNQERSLVAARHAVRMDPVAMVMWACVCSRLRHLAEDADGAVPNALGLTRAHLEPLPSLKELEHSIGELWSKQSEGIWPKYFPIFHYQDAGSNFCFTYEMLEAILVEFGRPENELLETPAAIQSLENAVSWCEEHKLKVRNDNTDYSGWNSGGQFESLRKGQPESWATAVVHMFLWELDEALSSRIQNRLLKKYNAKMVTKDIKIKCVMELMDIELVMKGERKSLKQILADNIVAKHQGEKQHSLFGRTLKKGARSALLFGPPGTSKTGVTAAIAKDLEWPLIQIDPSHFLENGLEQIYIKANEIFHDLSDLAAAVVLFDEMDALVQTREGETRLDIAAQFLTTFMLPKLTALHDQGKIIFFMATNFQERFDAAIKRAGRFDLLLCMGPPTLAEKTAMLHVFVDKEKADAVSENAAKLITEFSNADPKTKLRLELYTFGEFKSFVSNIPVGGKDIAQILTDLGAKGFQERVEDDASHVGLRVEELHVLDKVVFDKFNKALTTLQEYDKAVVTREEVSKELADKPMPSVVRYIFDRRESKQQD